MLRFLLALGLAAGLAASASAQDDEDRFSFAGDRYIAGAAPTSTDDVEGDLFAAGERVGVAGPVGGAAHLAGRRISLTAPIGGALYGAGMDLTVAAPVSGAATLAGLDVLVSADIGGNLRAAARHVTVDGDVGGSLLAVGQQVDLRGAVAGDADVTADELTFGEGARIEGTLTLRGISESEAEVPEGVAADIRFLDLPEGVDFDEMPVVELPGLGEIVLAAVAAFVFGVLVVAALGLATASLAPVRTEDGVERSFEGPGTTFLAGGVTLVLVLGTALLLALTGIGALALPLFALAVFLLGLAGYVMGAYAIGARILQGDSAGPPERFARRAQAALIGALVAGLLTLVPFLGWIFLLAITLYGVGVVLPARAAFGAEPV